LSDEAVVPKEAPKLKRGIISGDGTA